VYDTNATDDSEDPFEKCMTSFRLLQSHLKLLSRNNFDKDRSELVLNYLFDDVFGEEVDIFTNTMVYKVNQLEMQLATEEFHENESKAAFRVLKEQFQHFINYDCEDVSQYFLEFTRIEAQIFKDILLQHLDALEKSISERVLHKEEYDKSVYKKKLQIHEEQVHKVDVLEANLVVVESNGTESDEQDDNSRLGNDTDAVCAEIRPFFDSEPNFDREQMVKVQSIVDHIMPANEKQQSEQPNFSNEGEVDQNVVQCLVKNSESESLPDNLITETSNQTLESENILLKKTIAQFHKDFSKLEAHCISLELKLQNESLNFGNNGQSLNEQRERVDTLVKENELLKGQIQAKVFAHAALQNKLRRLTGQSVDTKFAKPSILGKPPSQTDRKQLVVRQPTAFKSERPKSSKSRFASQVVENYNLTKPVTPHSWPKENASVSAKSQHVIIPGSSRISSKTMSKTSIKSKES
jgi:hypothetical protein